jgi:SAM-dependent methyltransferase
MKEVEYARLAEHEFSYWWHVGRLKIIETYLQKVTKGKKDARILNVGCGTGGTLATLERYGSVDNVDVSDDALAFMRQHGYTSVQRVDGTKLPCQDEVYDIVGAFDVLEHIKDDAIALKEWSRVLKEDGSILLTVPAYQWLWSGHDVAVQHFRRYTKTRLKKVARAAGLGASGASYAFVFSLPLVVGFRVLRQKAGTEDVAEASFVDVPGWVNSMFTRFLYLEAKAHRYMSFPAGTSVIASLRKELADYFNHLSEVAWPDAAVSIRSGLAQPMGAHPSWCGRIEWSRSRYH